MAQPSKKDLIAEHAFELFLEHGIKGTSIDMVVKTAGTSKPTVYNHFPDKASLVSYVMAQWASKQPEPEVSARSISALKKELNSTWFSSNNVRLYGLLFGEGFRVPDAFEHFKQHFDSPWRNALKSWAQKNDIDANEADALASQFLMSRLLQ